MGSGKLIETGVDRLITLVQRKKRISLAEAAKSLSLPLEVIEEWASFLDDEEVLSVEYKFTTPYLVERKLSAREVASKAKEFTSRKTYFIRKAESVLDFLAQQHETIQQLKNEFDTLKTQLGGQASYLEKQFQELASFDTEKQGLDKKMREHSTKFRKELTDLDQSISVETKKFASILEELKEEKRQIVSEQERVVTLRQQEAEVLKKLNATIKQIEELRKKVVSQDSAILGSENHLRKLLFTFNKVNDSIEKRRATLKSLTEQNKTIQQDLLKKQTEIIDKMMKKSKSLDSLKNQESHSIKKFKRFFARKKKVEDLLNDVHDQHEHLRLDLQDLIKKAKVVDVYKKKATDVGDLTERFSLIDKRKKMLEKKLNALVRSFKSLT